MAPTSRASFSEKNQNLQLAWDSTSLYALMFCPLYYKTTIIDGYSVESIHLSFGIYLHEALEVFDRARADGKTRSEAQFLAVKAAALMSGTRDDDGNWIPWGGTYEHAWKCEGKVVNPKTNRKIMCPYSKTWSLTSQPSVCGSCGEETISDIIHIPQDPKEPGKTRETLIRTVAWYCEEQPEDIEDGVYPYILPNGEPAVELSFNFPLGVKTEAGEDFLVCGHMDGVAVFGNENYVRERKSTKYGLTAHYFDGFSPHAQVDTYDIAGYVLFPDLDIQGVILEAAQTMVGGSRFGRRVMRRTPALREEWLSELGYWVKMAERYATENHWPMNRSACRMCKLRTVCAREPDMREMFLKSEYPRKLWDPLQVR